jgi:AraC family transcriptional regulator
VIQNLLIPQFTTSLIIPPVEPPKDPVLLASSEKAGWEGLAMRAFHEPMRLENWIDPPGSDIGLMLVVGGSMEIEQRPLNGRWQKMTARSGDIFLSPGQNVAHETRWQSLSAEPIQTIGLGLSSELIYRTASEGLNLRRINLIGQAGFQDPVVTQICLALYRELVQPSSVGKLYAQTAAQMLAVHLLRHYARPATAAEPEEITQTLTHRQLNRIIEFLQDNLNRDLSLEVLAQQTGFSAYHFAHLFRQTTGESPHQFVLRQRIERAQHLLKETEAPLSQIALEVGFANQSHFSRIFKRYLGLTPRAYRRYC